MLIRKLAALAVVALVPLTAIAAEPENPYKNAKKGEWISYKFNAKAMGQDLAGTVKQTVIEKDDKSLTLEVTTSLLGMDQTQKQTIDLTKPFNPLAGANLPANADTKIEKKESGKEKIEVGGKKIDTEWTSYRISADANGIKIEGDVKIWMAKDVPIGGLAKMEMKMSAAGMAFEATMLMEKSGKD